MNLSLSRLFPDFLKTLKRFPLPLALCIVYLFVFNLSPSKSIVSAYVDRYLFIDVWFFLVLGTVFFESEWAKRRMDSIPYPHLHKTMQYALMLGCIGVLSLYKAHFFYANPIGSEPLTYFFDFFTDPFILCAPSVFFLLLFVAPYFQNKSTIDAQWYYQYKLLYASAIAIFISLIVYICLYYLRSMVKYLFSIDISYNHTSRLVVSVLLPFIFLRYLPTQFDETLKKNEGKLLKFLFSSIIIPFLCIFSIIFYAYAFKIIGTLSMPKGRIFYLVSIFGSIGVFTNLILSYSQYTLHTFTTRFLRYFPYILLPLLGLLLFSLWERIHLYGLTESRYLGCMVFIMLLAYVIFAIRKKEETNIQTPFTASALLLAISCFGPLGYANLSTTSQLKELTALLDKNHMLVDGHLTETPPKDLQNPEKWRISNILDYLYRKKQLHLLAFLKPNHPEIFNPVTLTAANNSVDKIAKQLNIPYTEIGGRSVFYNNKNGTPIHIQESIQGNRSITVKEYDRIQFFSLQMTDETPMLLDLKDNENVFKFHYDFSNKILTINKQNIAKPILSINLKQLTTKLAHEKNEDVIHKALTFTIQQGTTHLVMHFASLVEYPFFNKDKTTISLTGHILIKDKTALN